MTKFMTLGKEPKGSHPTVFAKSVSRGGTFDAKKQPTEWDNVMWLGYDTQDGDVFKAWNDNKNKFTIYFGTKGDEFDD